MRQKGEVSEQEKEKMVESVVISRRILRELFGMGTKGLFFFSSMCGGYSRIPSNPMRTSLTIAFHQPINFPGENMERGGST